MNFHFKDQFPEMENMFKRFLEHLQNVHRLPAEFFETPQGPHVNIYETDNHFIVLLEIPGCDPKETQVVAKDNTLIVQSERKPPLDLVGLRCFHLEITFGPFRREISLPAPINADDVKAEFRLGMLEVQLRKKTEEVITRQIFIEVKE